MSAHRLNAWKLHKIFAFEEMRLRILTKLMAKSYKQYTVRRVPYALRIHDLSTEGTCDFCFSTNAAVEILKKHC